MAKKPFEWLFVFFACALLFWSIPGHPDEAQGDPLSSKILKLTAPTPQYNRKKGTYVTNVTLTNRTRKPKLTFFGPLGLFVTGINPPDATLVNATGHTSNGQAYVAVPLPDQGLKSGKKQRVRLEFNNPSRKRLKVSYAVYGGIASSANFATGSGAIGVLATNGARVAFVPDGTSIRPVLLDGKRNIANGRAIAAAPVANAGPASGLGLSFSADACTVDAAALKVICVGFRSTRIALLDVSVFVSSLRTSDITVSEFDSGAPNVRLGFSGGGCVLCGVAADPGDRRFIVAANDGYRVYSYGSAAPTVYNIPVNENFSYDSARNQITAAEYDTVSSRTPRALNIVDLNKNKVYRWTGNTASCTDLGTATSSCQARADLDSTTVDLSTGVIALIFEHSTAVALIDMGQAIFEDATLTFAAPARYIEAGSAAPDQSGGAASTTGNYLFTAEELGDSNVGVMQLPAASGTGGVFPAVTPNPVYIDLSDAANPECAGNGSSAYRFRTKGDPHGVALFTGLVDGKQTGLLIDSSNSCAGLVDLAALLAAPRDPAKSTAVSPTVDLRASGIVRFVKLD